MSTMNKRDFFNAILKGFYEERSCTLKDFKKMIKQIMPVFGELQTEIINDNDNSITIKFIDYDIATEFIRVDADGNSYEVSDQEPVDMSTRLFNMSIDKDGRIVTVEHSYGLITNANKDTVLFLSSLINKKILIGE